MTDERFTHLGFDVSTTGAGAVYLDDDASILEAWSWQAPPNMTISRRLTALNCWAIDIFHALMGNTNGYLCLGIEAPFFRGGSSANLARAQGSVLSVFSEEWHEYTVTHVKTTAAFFSGLTTIGKDHGKEAMWLAMRGADAQGYVRLYELAQHHDDSLKALGDLADAYWVARADHAAVREARRER